MARVPKQFHSIFWDVDPNILDTEEYPEYIMERILEYGTMESVKWMRKTFGDERIKQFILGKGRRRLSTLTINFWQTILEFKPEECIPISSLKNRSRFWNY